MEIVFNNVGYKDKLNNVNLKIASNSIIGIWGKNKEFFIKLIMGSIKPLVGNVLINDIDINNDKDDLLTKQVAYIKSNPLDYYNNDIVLAEIGYIVDKNKYKNKNINKRIKDAFSLVGLNESYLTRSFNSLSSSELYLVQIAIEFICNPKTIIFDNPFSDLDYCNKKKLLKLIKLLKDKYHKMIFICDNNTDVLYQYTDKVLLLNDCNKVNLYNTYDLFTSIKFLTANGVEIPNTISFVSKAKLKGVKLTYQKDVRDIIKDIYKHV